MELINATGMQAGYTMGLQPDGRELLVVVVKGTFAIPKDPNKEPVLAEEQVPLVEADVFTGEPGFSAPLYESDYAPRKPRCDILVNGSAYAPGGKPTERVTVSLRVGSWQKSFDVVGNRYWKRGILLVTPTVPEPFTMMPISYNNAFGGVDRSQEDPVKHRWYPTRAIDRLILGILGNGSVELVVRSHLGIPHGAAIWRRLLREVCLPFLRPYPILAAVMDGDIPSRPSSL